jgi:choline kinase
VSGAVRQAVILAAGMGTRLRGELTDRPKGFLSLGTEPIIDESIDRLLAAGISHVLIVTGHCREFYDALAQRRAEVATVHNPRFADSGSMYSLFCAREQLAGDYLLLESDLIYEPRALDVLLASPGADAILLSGPTGAGDEVYVSAPAGRLLGMSKDPRQLDGPVTGELVGITRVSLTLSDLMMAIAADAFRESLRFDYETDCLVAAGRSRPIACPLVDDLCWAEIDDPAHLERARSSVYPEILRRSRPTR